jgi:hypothetical protein
VDIPSVLSKDGADALDAVLSVRVSYQTAPPSPAVRQDG